MAILDTNIIIKILNILEKNDAEKKDAINIYNQTLKERLLNILVINSKEDKIKEIINEKDTKRGLLLLLQLFESLSKEDKDKVMDEYISFTSFFVNKLLIGATDTQKQQVKEYLDEVENETQKK